MESIRYRPKIDKLFFILLIATLILLLAMTLPTAIAETSTLYFSVPIDLFVLYFFASPLFGYVELRENELFIKYGFILKKHIQYGKIRDLERKRSFISESIMSLKNSFEHVNIKYNSFDVTSVSVSDNDAFVNALREKIGKDTA